ncbi:uncharacterized protein LOC108920237 [Scleropages formosus]|uniref:uncharacterized protein LOC108920237 n=1 Tax=Scleropages formosus TaxID=113540 RepID=UPI000877F186|nr:uncharacterized protein LOC108920237 [Scleropages formosus]
MLHPTATGELLTDNDQFLSFAKRSQTVRRGYEMEKAAFLPPFLQPWSSPQATFDFWNSNERSEVPTTPYKFLWTENHIDVSTEAVGGTMEQASFEGLRWLRDAGPGLERLPTPAELMGRRKKGGGRAAAEGTDAMQHKGAVVLHHIRDLKKRQDAIDQLKKEKWWGSAADRKSNATEQLAMLVTMSPGHLETPDGSNSCIGWGHNAATGVLFPPVFDKKEVTFGGYEKELSLVPGGNPMLSFVLANAERQVHGSHYIPYSSQKEFWKFK